MVSPFDFFKAHWSWEENELICTRYSQQKSKKDITSSKASHPKVKSSRAWGQNIRFYDNIDLNRQREFRNIYWRQNRVNMPDVINLQDVKNLVHYLAIGKIPKIFIMLYHSKLVDKFLISLIAYFQVYLEVLDDLKWRRTFKGVKLKHPVAQKRESYCSNWLSKLRCRVGQEYSAILVGVGKLMDFHHMNNKLLESENIKDIIIYEYLYKFAAKTVWVALNRSNNVDIRLELDRIFRTNGFKEKGYVCSLGFQSDELNVIHNERKCLDKMHLISPAIDELFKTSHDLKFFMEHYKSLEDIISDETVSYLNAIFIIPEELYSYLGITLGILGMPRENYDVTLQVKEKLDSVKFELELGRKSCEEKIHQIEDIPMKKLYETLSHFENQIVLPVHIKIEEKEWYFTRLVSLLRYAQEEDSMKYIKIWQKHMSDIQNIIAL